LPCKITFMKTNKNILIGILIIAVAVILRVVQPIHNFAPIVAVALFSGYLFKNFKQGLMVALIASFIGDVVIAYINKYDLFHDTFVFVYGSYALIALLGSRLNSDKFSWSKLAVLGITASLLFFIVSNLGVFLMSDLYIKDINGFVNCFVMAIPFYKYSMISDLIYIPLIFGIYQYTDSFIGSLSREYIHK